MTDIELLELAAKAAGIACDSKGPFTSVDRYDLYNGIYTEYLPWNPLTDDGDALRLAVKLGIHLMHSKHKIKAGRKLIQEGPCEEDKGADPYAATRRAIVRAAAEIGKAMP